MANFLSYPIFQDIILPFVLIFALIFAVLQKSKLLGEGKQQIDAIIAFVVAAILISFSTQVDWIRQFVWFLVIALVLLFVFMLLHGFAYGTNKENEFLKEQDWLKPAIGTILFVAVIVAGLVITGYWGKTIDFFSSGDLGSSLIFVVIAIVAIAVVIKMGKPGDKKG